MQNSQILYQKAVRSTQTLQTALASMSMCLKNVPDSVEFHYRVDTKEQITPQTQQIDISPARDENVVFDDLPFAPIEHL